MLIMPTCWIQQACVVCRGLLLLLLWFLFQFLFNQPCLNNPLPFLARLRRTRSSVTTPLLEWRCQRITCLCRRFVATNLLVRIFSMNMRVTGSLCCRSMLVLLIMTRCPQQQPTPTLEVVVTRTQVVTLVTLLSLLNVVDQRVVLGLLMSLLQLWRKRKRRKSVVPLMRKTRRMIRRRSVLLVMKTKKKSV